MSRNNKASKTSHGRQAGLQDRRRSNPAHGKRKEAVKQCVEDENSNQASRSLLALVWYTVTWPPRTVWALCFWLMVGLYWCLCTVVRCICLPFRVTTNAVKWSYTSTISWVSSKNSPQELTEENDSSRLCGNNGLAEITESSGDLEVRLAWNRALERELDEQKRDSKRELEKLETAVKELKRANTTLKQGNGELMRTRETDIARGVEKAKTAERSIAELKGELTKLKASEQKEKQRASNSERSVADMKEQVAKYKAFEKEGKQRDGAKEQTIAKLKGELERFNANVLKEEARASSCERTIRELEERTSEKERTIAELKGQLVKLETSKGTKALKQQPSDEQSKFKDLNSELDKLRQEHNKVQEEVSSSKQVIEEFEKGYKKDEAFMLEQKKQIKQFDVMLDRATRDLQHESKQKQIADKARAEAERRLGELMSARLRDNNPNIVDLNDKYRPQKLGEMFSEVYDNQWSDAFTIMEKTVPDTQIISFLLDIVMDSFEYCKALLEEKWATVVEWHLLENSPTYTQTKQALKEGRKLLVVQLAPSIAQEYMTNIAGVCMVDDLSWFLQRPETIHYIQECVKVALLACATDPAVDVQCPGWTSFRQDVDGQHPRQGTSQEEMDGDVENYSDIRILANGQAVSDTDIYERVPLNKDITREYTARGRYIEYNVWPAIFLYKGGPMLGKGIAQGTNERYGRSGQSKWVWWKKRVTLIL